ncbi:MAG: DNA polymerase, partial [Acidobacteria bacterium]|nr:DNA polymerase [Acidobacteriota bacterium]
WALVKGIVPPYSTTGQLSLQYDFWAEHLPKAEPDLLMSPQLAVGLEPRLSVWLRYCRIRKLLSTYLNVYALGDAHYPHYHNLGARTGRVSCVRPNLQNIPKRRDGIRALFIPERGRVFIEADYRAAEMVALAQIFHLLYGGSVLGDAINAGEDIHTTRAKTLTDKDWDTLSDTDKKKLRQGAKAVNFGLPGGLGPRKFLEFARKPPYNLKDWTLDDAQAVRARALAEDDALRSYLQDTRSPEALLRLAAANIGVTFPDLVRRLEGWRDEDSGSVHWRLAIKRLRAWANGDRRFEIPTLPGFKPAYDLFRTTSASPAGFIRGRASYTEGHNLPF